MSISRWNFGQKVIFNFNKTLTKRRETKSSTDKITDESQQPCIFFQCTILTWYVYNNEDVHYFLTNLRLVREGKPLVSIFFINFELAIANYIKTNTQHSDYACKSLMSILVFFFFSSPWSHVYCKLQFTKSEFVFVAWSLGQKIYCIKLDVNDFSSIKKISIEFNLFNYCKNVTWCVYNEPNDLKKWNKKF